MEAGASLHLRAPTSQAQGESGAASDAEISSAVGDHSRNDGQLPDAVEHFQRLLIRDYLRAEDIMDAGMMPAGVEPTVANVQVNLIILIRSDLRTEFSDQTFASQGDMWRVEHVFTLAAEHIEAINLDSLFSDIPDKVLKGQNTFGVLAVASAGCGKTFVFTLVAPHRWAMKELWPEFDIVIARELRSKCVREADGVSQLLGLSSYDMDDVSSKREICDYVRDHPERVCVILDGLDETSLSKCSEFMVKVIRGKTLHGIRLIVTSRPCADVFTLSTSRQFQRRVELVGFRPGDVEVYIQKVLPVEEASALIAEVRQDGNLLAMMATPFIAKETCRMYRHHKFVPRCVADVFERMIVQIAERRAGAEFGRWSVIPKNLQGLILDLGGFAFNMLIQQRLIFTEEDIRKHSISGDAIALGLLVACDPLPKDSDKQWRFSHLTMQENLAAKYQACCKPLPLSRIVRLVETLGSESGHLRTFWVLLAAQLGKDGVDRLIYSLLTKDTVGEWHASIMEDEDFCISDPFPLNYIGPLSEVLEEPQLHRLAEELLSNSITGGSGQELVERKLRQQHSRMHNVDFLYVLLTTWTSMVSEADDKLLVSAIEKSSHRAADYCRICFGGHDAYSADKESPFGEIVTRLELAFQCFAEYAQHCDGSWSPLSSIAAALAHSDGLVALTGNQHPAKLRTMDTVLRCHPTDIRMVNVYDFTPTSPGRFPASLTQCCQLTRIMIVRCTVDREWEIICAAIRSSASTIQELQIRDPTETGLALLAPAIAACTTLWKLAVKSDEVSAVTKLALASSLSSLTSLDELRLEVPEFGDDAAGKLFLGLSGCSMMSDVRVTSCGLSAHVLPALALAMSFWPQLQELDLEGNDFSDVTESDAEDFIKAVNDAPSLWWLVLPKPRRADNPSLNRIADRASYHSHDDFSLCLFGS